MLKDIKNVKKNERTLKKEGAIYYLMVKKE